MEIKINRINSKSIINKSNLPGTDEVINNYTGCTHGCIYCYAEFMKRFTGHTEEWSSFIDIKNFDKEKFIKYISSIKEKKKILMCSVTDPYIPEENKIKSTRKILEIFSQVGNNNIHPEILTKSTLVLRDIELLKK